VNLQRAVFAILTFGALWAQNTVVVSGRITSSVTGLPVENAIVTLVRGASDKIGNTGYTDAAGNYSFSGVAPGTAQIEIRAEGFAPFHKTNPDDTTIQIAADSAIHNFKLTPAASITGRIIDKEPDQRMMTTLLREDFSGGVRHFVVVGQDTEAAAMSVVAPDGSFRFAGLEPGRYIVKVSPQTSQAGMYFRVNSDGTNQSFVMVADPETQEPSEGYTATYYPGSTEFTDALPVTLAAGDSQVLNFRMVKRRLFHASGEIELAGMEGSTALISIDSVNGGSASTTVATLPGPFKAMGLPAGQYVATATIIGAGLQAKTPVAITDHDVEGLKFSFAGQLEVSGTFRMATGSAHLPVGLAVQYAFPSPDRRADSIPAAENGEFWLSGYAGDYSVQPTVPAGYAVTEVRYGGANYLNSLVSMRGDTLDPSLTIVLTDQPGLVAGSIVDGDSEPVPATIALVPDPLPASFDFRAIRVAKNDAKGVFAFRGIAPGRYKAVALTDDDRKRDHDMAILGDRLNSVDSFEVIAGQSVTINIRPRVQ
jgi:hypothetical protein